LVIVTRNGPGGQYRKYRCSQHFYRGACPNNLLERQDWLEERLLRELQQEVLKPETVEYAIQAFGRQLKDALEKMSNELAQMRERKTKIETELRRRADTAAQTEPSDEAINDREKQLRDITERLLSTGPGSVESHLAEIRGFITKRLSDLQGLLARDTTLARAELKKHVEEIRMIPQYGAGKPH
jgi:site-specific DNA recombinase